MRPWGWGALVGEAPESEPTVHHLWPQQVQFSTDREPSSLQRLYRSGDAESLHRYTLVPDHPDFARARLNALHLSDVSEPAVPAVCVLSCKIIHAQTGFYMFKKKQKGRLEP